MSIDIGRCGDSLVLIDGQRWDAARAEERQARLDFEAPVPRRRRASRPESFHVRSAPHMTAEELTEGQEKAVHQEAQMLAWFRERPGLRATPSEVNAAFPQWPLTSVRRAMTDLTNMGHLVHYTRERRRGPFGAMESCWGLA